jgi:putative endonuclease
MEYSPSMDVRENGAADELLRLHPRKPTQRHALYIGMTDDLSRRVFEHQTGALPGFTRKYRVKLLVWFEQHETRESAFHRERAMKKWNRAWKMALIERSNPSWRDLALELEP